MKTKTCKVCEMDFQPFQTTQKVCSHQCAIEEARRNHARKAKNDHQRRKREFKLQDRPYQIKLAQAAFNAYIRARDSGKGCISCKKNSGAKMNAGHYLTVGAHPALRFEPDNCHLQCEWCNSYLSGNIARYRINLTEKIGLERVEWLEGPHPAQHWTIEEIIEIKNDFKARKKAITEGAQ